MALAKITLKLGKKTIELTSEQFEELKQDMRDLDKSHNYYWHNSPWYQPWYYNQPVLREFTTCNLVGSASNFSSSDAANRAVSLLPAKPPNFSGSVVSVC